MTESLKWFTSSYSGSQGGDFVEIAYHWRKSSYSNEDGGNCVEVAAHPGAIHVRDSKDPEGPALTFSPAAWAAFAAFAAAQDVASA
jgi:hypothetical protein